MDQNNLEQIRAHLQQTSSDFNRLSEEHHQHDARLAELASRHYLTEDEQIEEVRLKKLKLHCKTQMQAMIDEHQAQHV